MPSTEWHGEDSLFRRECRLGRGASGEAVADGVSGGCGAGLEPELGQDAGDVVAHGVAADAE